MTTTIESLTTTTYVVTMGFCSESWEDETLEDGSINYDTQPSTCRTVEVTLPIDATPMGVYEAADAKVDDAEVLAELREMGGSGIEGDGFEILNKATNTIYSISYDSISREHTWDQFHAYKRK